MTPCSLVKIYHTFKSIIISVSGVMKVLHLSDKTASLPRRDFSLERLLIAGQNHRTVSSCKAAQTECCGYFAPFEHAEELSAVVLLRGKCK
jgi:hypothetical protein